MGPVLLRHNGGSSGSRNGSSPNPHIRRVDSSERSNDDGIDLVLTPTRISACQSNGIATSSSATDDSRSTSSSWIDDRVLKASASNSSATTTGTCGGCAEPNGASYAVHQQSVGWAANGSGGCHGAHGSSSSSHSSSSCSSSSSSTSSNSSSSSRAGSLSAGWAHTWHLHAASAINLLTRAELQSSQRRAQIHGEWEQQDHSRRQHDQLHSCLPVQQGCSQQQQQQQQQHQQQQQQQQKQQNQHQQDVRQQKLELSLKHVRVPCAGQALQQHASQTDPPPISAGVGICARSESRPRVTVMAADAATATVVALSRVVGSDSAAGPSAGRECGGQSLSAEVCAGNHSQGHPEKAGAVIIGDVAGMTPGTPGGWCHGWQPLQSPVLFAGGGSGFAHWSREAEASHAQGGLPSRLLPVLPLFLHHSGAGLQMCGSQRGQCELQELVDHRAHQRQRHCEVEAEAPAAPGPQEGRKERDKRVCASVGGGAVARLAGLGVFRTAWLEAASGQQQQHSHAHAHAHAHPHAPMSPPSWQEGKAWQGAAREAAASAAAVAVVGGHKPGVGVVGEEEVDVEGGGHVGHEAQGHAARDEEQHHQRRVHVSTAGQLLAGGIAGAVSKTCTAPLARLTILFQVQGMSDSQQVRNSRPSIWGEARRIVKEEGFLAFWKGNTVTIVHRLPYSAINFFAYESYKSILEALGNEEEDEALSGVPEFPDEEFLVDEEEEMYVPPPPHPQRPQRPRTLGEDVRDACIKLVAGGGAGITAATLTYPLDLVRTRLAAQTKSRYYKGIMGTMSTIVRDEGILGLYKGMGATLLGVGPNLAINFCVYETVKAKWIQSHPETPVPLVSLGCGSLAGICSSTATFPLDLIRRRRQLEGAGGMGLSCAADSNGGAASHQAGGWLSRWSPRQRRDRVASLRPSQGIPAMFAHIVRTEGWWALYRGIIPEYWKVVPGVSIAFMTYEFMKKLLQQQI